MQRLARDFSLSFMMARLHILVLHSCFAFLFYILAQPPAKEEAD
ncbi:hypothetical protein GMES_3345 [Paraglaciecola mesophila KMM 241]|uniref:Uncharacterized protein n=1 Tax=Paraglaciecola mesophila KMM 241 TaxID=1128912 RepID=K6Z9G5_9ALTE|nr:hypothetical protein GMES_3345 [Paraglaciecola mesophila KMM 241]